MTEHYYTSEPQSEHDILEFTAKLRGLDYKFTTDAGVFSRTEIDMGTELLIDALSLNSSDQVLDLGCGYGPLGMVAANLVGEAGFVDLVDINHRAVDLAQKNLATNNISNAKVWVSEGFSNVTKQYDWIITNPPIRTGKKYIHSLVEEAVNYLKPSGRLMVVIRTKQGAKSMATKMEQVFGNVSTVIIKSGYRVLESEN